MEVEGKREGGKEKSRGERRREANWKISSSGRHQKKKSLLFYSLLFSFLLIINVDIFTFSHHITVVYLLTNVINCH